MKKFVLVSIILNIAFALIAVCSVLIDPKLESVSLNYSSYELEVDSRVGLCVIVEPAIAEAYVTYWSSSNSEVASVSDNGSVWANSLGECVISAMLNNGEVLTCEIKVVPTIAKRIDLEVEYTTISVGYSQKISYNIYPSSTTYKYVTWSTSDSSVVSIDDDGNICGVGAGVAQITAELYGNVTETITINVVNEILPSSFTLRKTSIELLRGKSDSVGYDILPKTVTNKEIVWESSDTSIATVSSNGTIVGVKKGVAYITARTANGIEQTITVNVKEIPLTGASADNGSSFLVGLSKIGSSVTIKLKLFPTNTTTKPSEITFKSQDTSVATVSSSGRVTFVGEGSTYIILYADGKAVGSVLVAVYEGF